LKSSIAASTSRSSSYSIRSQSTHVDQSARSSIYSNQRAESEPDVELSPEEQLGTLVLFFL
jgi:hypothetical protein